MRDMLDSNRCMSIRLLADECHIPKSTVHRIVTENLGMHKICTKMVPKVLSDDKKASRARICHELLEQCESNFCHLDFRSYSKIYVSVITLYKKFTSFSHYVCIIPTIVNLFYRKYVNMNIGDYLLLVFIFYSSNH